MSAVGHVSSTAIVHGAQLEEYVFRQIIRHAQLPPLVRLPLAHHHHLDLRHVAPNTPAAHAYQQAVRGALVMEIIDVLAIQIHADLPMRRAHMTV
jgi:hypothetical protein